MTRPLKALLAVIAIAMVMAPALPAWANPANTAITVYQGPCEAAECGTGDVQIADGDIAKGTVQVKVRSTSSTGLTSMELQASFNNGSWICIRKWATSSGNFSAYTNWSTTVWPGSSTTPPTGCSANAAYGDMTSNGDWRVRVIATDQLGTQSAMTALKVNNRPSVPAWADDPVVEGDATREPIVELRWAANPEPDILEYHFVRTGPDGDQREYAVSSSKPGGQGCDRDGTGYICFDDDFPSEGFEGTYTYSLIAFRSSPASSTPCALSSGTCVQSAMSDDIGASLDEPEPPSPDPTPTSSSGGGRGGRGSTGGTTSSPTSGSSTPRTRTSGGSGASYCDFYCGEYKKNLPYDPKQVLVPSGGNGGRPVFAAGPGLGSGISVEDDAGNRLWTSLAGGLLLILFSAHMARLLRRHG